MNYNKKVKDEKWNIRTMFGPNLNFAGAEAYKFLRSNLMFSFSEESTCRVIGVTSSLQGEGKSSTSCNIAYSFAETGASVLLLEADLRRPTMATKLGLSRSPGLSNLLVARSQYEDVLQHCSVAPAMHIITSGDIPPNPAELLNSNRMAVLMEQLKQNYDYIIVDLPPVTAVSDTITVAKMTDGVIMVVREGVADQQELDEAMRQLDMVGVRKLGFVYRQENATSKKYKYYAEKKA